MGPCEYDVTTLHTVSERVGGLGLDLDPVFLTVAGAGCAGITYFTSQGWEESVSGRVPWVCV